MTDFRAMPVMFAKHLKTCGFLFLSAFGSMRQIKLVPEKRRRMNQNALLTTN